MGEGQRFKTPVNEGGNGTAHWPPDSSPLVLLPKRLPDLIPGALCSKARMTGQIHECLHEVQDVLHGMEQPRVFELVPMHVESGGEAAPCFLDAQASPCLGAKALGHAR